ncbi:MAG: hypothetical protein ACK4NZ_01120 [Tsuneonella sp.]
MTQPTLSVGRVAIIGPSFFSYVQNIAAEFSSRGMDVIVRDEKRSNSRLTKIAFRLGLSSRMRGQQRYLSDLADELIAGGWPDILILAPEVINRRFVAKLVNAGARVHLYSWDGSRNKGQYREYLDLLSSRGSFDPDDAAQYDMRYFPLFAQRAFLPDEAALSGPVEFDVSFCGTLHSGRAAMIARLARIASERSIRFGFLPYYHSRVLFALRSLASLPGLRLLPQVRSTAFPQQQVAAMMMQSKFVLDMVHPGQCGLTARTFETFGCGAMLLTNNARALDVLPPALLERTQVFNDIDELAAFDFAGTTRPGALDPASRYYVSLDRFVDDLIDLASLGARFLSPGHAVYAREQAR